MAIQLNGQEVGPVKFTDDKPGKTLHVGLVNPTNPVDGDLWIDSDALNNAGKNLIQTIDANTGTDSITFAVSPEYKDLHVVLRGLSNTLGGTVLIRTNGATTGYLNAGGVATNAFFTVPFLKASVSVNQLQFTIYDAQHSASSMWGRLEGYYNHLVVFGLEISSKQLSYLMSLSLNKIYISTNNDKDKSDNRGLLAAIKIYLQFNYNQLLSY